MGMTSVESIFSSTTWPEIEERAKVLHVDFSYAAPAVSSMTSLSSEIKETSAGSAISRPAARAVCSASSLALAGETVPGNTSVVSTRNQPFRTV